MEFPIFLSIRKGSIRATKRIGHKTRRSLKISAASQGANKNKAIPVKVEEIAVKISPVLITPI